MKSKPLFWSAFERIGQQSSQLLVSIILARIIQPDEFGLVAIVLFFVNLATVVADSGFGVALIRLPSIDRDHETTVFYANITLGLFSSACLYLIAPLISLIYNKDELKLLLQALSAQTLIFSLGVVQNSLLIKRLKFQRQAMVSISSTIGSGIIGIILALNRFGAWSLIAQSVTRAFFSTFLLWVIGGWRSLGKFRISILRKILPFSLNLLFSSVLNVTFENLYSLLIGKIFTLREVGIFGRAQQLQQYPASLVTGVVGKVSLPFFATIQDEREKLRSKFRESILTLSALFIPSMAAIAASASSLILVILGDSWKSVTIYFRIMCFSGMLYPVHAINLNMQTALGKSQYQLISEIIKKAANVVIILITFKFNLLIVSWGYLVISVVSLLVNAYFTTRLIEYTVFEQLKDIGKYVAYSMIPYIIAFCVDRVAISNQLLKLMLSIVAFLFTYSSVVVLCNDRLTIQIYRLTLNYIKDILRRNK